jgi:hypothetical protein
VTPDGAERSARTLAIWRLKPLGLDAATAGRLESLLRAEAGRITGFALQPHAVTEQRLTAHPELSACAGETACLCRIGRALQVDRLATGVIGALGDDYTFDLKLIDVATCRELRRINEALSGREDVLIGAVRQALYKLLAPSLVVGSLRIELPVPGARVEVDGRLVGETPLGGPVTDLRPGLHRIRIHKAGFRDFTEDVPVRFQQSTRIRVDLAKSVLTGLTYEREARQPKPTASAPATIQREATPSGLRLAAWSTTGLAVLAAATAGVLGWRAWETERQIEDAAGAAEPYLSGEHRAVFDRGERYALAANVGWGVAGAAALTAAVLWIVDVAGNPTEAEASPEPAAAHLSPVWRGSGVGARLRMRF